MMGGRSSRSVDRNGNATSGESEIPIEDLPNEDEGYMTPQASPSSEEIENHLGAVAASIGRLSDFEEIDGEYEVMSLSDVIRVMNRTIDEVAQLTNQRKTLVRILLNHVKWDQDRFMERFYGDDLAAFFEAAGAVLPEEFVDSPPMSPSSSLIDVVGVADAKAVKSRNNENCSQPKKAKIDKATVCGICFELVDRRRDSLSLSETITTSTNIPICFELVDRRDSLILFETVQTQITTSTNIPENSYVENNCGHSYCLDCWRNYLAGKIIDEGMASFIQCPGFDCNILLEDDLVLRLITDGPVRERYKRRITEEFVDCHRLMKWCPGPDCTKVIKTSLTSHGHVRCECGVSFCFCCGGDVHDPVNCEILKVWMKKVEKDSETGNWMRENTKECPKCNALIEKNGGCNHMTCRIATCRYEFCWVCLGPWTPHGNTWFKCNRFESKDAQDARDQLSVKRFELERFLFYSNRFKNHMDSLKFEDKLASSVESTMKILCEKGLLIHMDFATIKNSVEILTRCRRTLAYTYVFAFALKKTNQCHIFEDNQRDLEMATENLSELLEHRFNEECEQKDIKVVILNQADYCEGRRKILMNHVREGEILSSWEFLPIIGNFFAPLDPSPKGAVGAEAAEESGGSGGGGGILHIFGS